MRACYYIADVLQLKTSKQFILIYIYVSLIFVLCMNDGQGQGLVFSVE